MIYVGSAESADYDQVLDSIMVGPIPVGINKFVFSVRVRSPLSPVPFSSLPPYERYAFLLTLSYSSNPSQAPAPNIELLPKNDVLGVTVVLLSCSYVDKPFVQVGYYVNNEYADEELKENPPERIMFDKLYRNILAEKPKVTRYPINWW
ncbi:ASF1 like histone chaperone-domain-containing protein, partial [Jimgerdemannia flammicorona]